MTGQPGCANEPSLASRAAGLTQGGWRSPDLVPSWWWAAAPPEDALLEPWALSLALSKIHRSYCLGGWWPHVLHPTLGNPEAHACG